MIDAIRRADRLDLPLCRQGYFINFLPAMRSTKAKKAVGKKIRDWNLNRRSGTDLTSLAREINAQVRGWFKYYGAFYRSELSSIAARIEQHLVQWVMRKLKQLRVQPWAAWKWLESARRASPNSSLTGIFFHPLSTDLQEPDELRDSRTVP